MIAEHQLNNQADSPFTLVGWSSAPQKIIDCDDGYVYYYEEVFKTNYTTNSNLYLVKITTSFTSGHTARENGTLQPNGKAYKDYYLKRGYVHALLSVPSEGSKHGGAIYPKQFWPRSSDVQTTISSSTGGSSTLSNEFSGMVDMGNGAQIGGKSGSSMSYSFSKSNSYITSDPLLSAQYGSTSYEAQWSFQVSKMESPAARITYTLESYFLFEMDKFASGYNVNAFTLKLTFLYVGQFRNIFGIWDGWEFTGGHSIACFY